MELAEMRVKRCCFWRMALALALTLTLTLVLVLLVSL